MSERELFVAALHLTDPGARAAFLDQACGADRPLRDRVLSLLIEHDKMGSFLDAPAAAPPADAGTRAFGEPPVDATHTFGSGSAEATADRPSEDEHAGVVIAGKYTLVEAVGEGGMGSVWRAKQTEPVKRFVAVKLIKAGMDSRQVLARFEAERQALALMDHPNIAKVLDGGVHDHRPYFVMELVKGTPITDYCDRLRLTPRERLELFVPVCQAIQHAHQKGIIHRDIKPSNVLVALYDDKPVVKVIDFGVAKATGGALTERTIDTGFGGVVGTPQYMSPEQATFNNLDIDTRSDVYALGVLLYELLTGSPPFSKRELEKKGLLEILRVVREEEPPRPSTKLSTADALPTLSANRGTEPKKLAGLLRNELDWIVMKALEKDRTRRYETANGFAADVRRYLSGEAVQAHPPSVGYRLKKFVRRNPLQLAMAGMAAVLVLGGISVVWWQAEQAGARREADLRRQLVDEQRASADAARFARNGEAVASLLGQAEDALKAGDAAKAAVALEAATTRSAEGMAVKEADRLARLSADLALLRDLDAVDQFNWTVVDSKFPDAAAVASRTRDALRRFGADPDTVSADKAAARVTTSVVRERIVSALDRLMGHQKSIEARTLLRRVDADPYRDAVRDAILARDGAKFVEFVSRATATHQPPGFVIFLSNAEKDITEERQRQLLQSAVSRRPGNLSLLMKLGGTAPSDTKEGRDESLRWYQAALAADPENVAAHNNLGTVLKDKGLVDEAIACYQRAIEVDPKLVVTHYNLGNALKDKGQVDEAVTCYRRALELDPKFVMAHYNLGNVLREKGQVDEAIACYRKAIELNPKFANAHNNLGIALVGKDRVDEAIACYKTALDVDPKNAKAHHNLGNALRGKDRVDEAIASYRKALELDPNYANAHTSLGIVLKSKGQLDEAIACYRRAIELDPKDANVHNNLGSALVGKDRVDEAIACYTTALELDPKNANAHHNLGIVLKSKGQLDEAIACYKKAIEFNPKLAVAHHSLGLALKEKGQLDEAIACYRKAIELDPKYAVAHYNLGIVLNDNGQADEAIACYRWAIELDPKHPEAHCNLGHTLASQGRYAESQAALKRGHELGTKKPGWRYPSAEWVRRAEALAGLEATLPALIKGEYQPRDNPERLRLAAMCQLKKLNHTAAVLLAAAFAVDAKLADDLKLQHRYIAACLASLAAAGLGEDAATLDDATKAKLRGRALDWLRADMALYTKQLANGSPADRADVQKKMRHWLEDADLASLRDAAALAKLPADEQKAFTQLWADVSALLKKAEEKPNAGPPPAPKDPEKKPEPAPPPPEKK